MALVLVVTAVMAAAVPSVAGAGNPRLKKPTITGFAATPAVITTAGGGTDVHATVSAGSCELSSTPSIPGLPEPVACPGSARATVFPPLAAGRRPAKYRLTLITTVVENGVTLRASKSTTVKVEVGDGGALTNVRFIEGSSEGYCAVLTTTGVDCWGSDSYGQLGDGVVAARPINAAPVAVVGVGGSGLLTGVTELTAFGSGEGYCALLTSSNVVCWGNSDYGQLGNGQMSSSSTEVDSAVPVVVSGIGGTGQLSAAGRLRASDNTICAVESSLSSVACWGEGDNGELGDGSYLNSAVPEQVQFPTTTGSYNFGPQLESDGQGFCVVDYNADDFTLDDILCWGAGAQGQLGDGTFASSDVANVVLASVPGTNLSLPLYSPQVFPIYHSGYCALTRALNAWCWGRNDVGQLGNGSRTDSSLATEVKGSGGTGVLASVAGIAASSEGTVCAGIGDGSSTECWGDNVDGALGGAAPPAGYSTVPVYVIVTGTLSLFSPIELLGGDTSSNSFCGFSGPGALSCWGDYLANLPTPSGASPIGATADAVPSSPAPGPGWCTVLSTGTAECWGLALGDGSTSSNPSATPQSVLAPT